MTDSEKKILISRLNKYIIRPNSHCIDESIDQKSLCHKWDGSYDTNGFPRISFKNKSIGVRRLIWIINFGDVPEKMYVLNSCGNNKCINPDHLFISIKKKNKYILHKSDRPQRERLSIDVPIYFMEAIRKLASQRNITLTKYILRIIASHLKKELSYQ